MPLLALLLLAQGPLDLGPPTATISQDFSLIAGLAEFGDGRWLVVDARDALVYVVDPRGDRREQLGRNGQGPGEYLRPFGVVRGLGDTLLIYDPNRRQFLKVDGRGQLAGDAAMDISVARGGIAPPRGTDREGRIYWERVVVGEEPGLGIKRAQQSLVVRWRPGSMTLDTVARISDHAPALHSNRFHPFAEHDAWVVTPDGRIGVIVAADYHLRWVESGRVVSNQPPLRFTPVEITAEDREAYRQERARQSGGISRMDGPRNAEPSPAARRQMAVAFPDELFPKQKPPFEENGAWRSPGGDIWVARSGTYGEKRRTIDVLDPSGALRRSVRLPEGRRVVALERGGIYLARVDEDGLEFLERYDWPAGLR